MSKFFITHGDKKKCWIFTEENEFGCNEYLRHRNHVLRIVTGFLPSQLAALAGNRGLGLQESKQLNVNTKYFKLMLQGYKTWMWLKQKYLGLHFLKKNLCRFMLFLMFYCILSAKCFQRILSLIYLKLLFWLVGSDWVIFCAPVCPICLEMFSTCSLVQSFRVNCCCVLFTSCSYCTVL